VSTPNVLGLPYINLSAVSNSVMTLGAFSQRNSRRRALVTRGRISEVEVYYKIQNILTLARKPKGGCHVTNPS
jgi:hypothetical protein